MPSQKAMTGAPNQEQKLPSASPPALVTEAPIRQKLRPEEAGFTNTELKPNHDWDAPAEQELETIARLSAHKIRSAALPPHMHHRRIASLPARVPSSPLVGRLFDGAGAAKPARSDPA
jgi:hypothetical protein